MQTVINHNPVWITYRDRSDISIDEVLQSEDFNEDTPLKNLDVSDIGTLAAAVEHLEGWYFATCSPGCMPDSSFFGPYKTEAEAMEEAEKFYNV